MLKYPLVVFDFDGTLAESFPWFLSILNTLADKYHFKTTAPGEVAALRGMEAKKIMRHLGIPGWKMPWIGKDLRARMAQDISRIRLFPGVAEMLQQLSCRGTTLAIVTSNSRKNVQNILGPENTALIQYYACQASLSGKSKKLRQILKASGFGAQEAIYLGDELRDWEAAGRVGIAFGGVAWGYSTPEALQARAAKVFQRVEDILPALGA